MRVALFFDGKNFYRSLADTHPHLEIDYDKLAAWVVRQAGGVGAEFRGAYYYTGHSEPPGSGSSPFTLFLKKLDLRAGYFVKREPRVRRHSRCRHCRREWYYWTEKRVDTRLVADMIHYAAVDAYDIAVLFSGDQDLVPAVEAAERLGRQVYVATWSGRGLSRELRTRCFGEIDLGLGIDEFQTGRHRGAVPLPEMTPQGGGTASSGTQAAVACLPPMAERIEAEVKTAEARLPYVSRWYFENRWIGTGLPPMGSPDRASAVEEAMRGGKIEQYEYRDQRDRVVCAIRSKTR